MAFSGLWSWETKSKDPDYDEEALKLFASLGMHTRNHTPYNELDVIYKHPNGSVIYVGNQTAASTRSILDKHKITHVVNCTHTMNNFFEQTGEILYYRFDVALWTRYVNDTNESVLQFINPVFDFINSAHAAGNSVLVHCLAGAHRAGTTGCLCLMHYNKLSSKDAIKMAKYLRPIIDPIGSFPEFLKRVEQAKNSLPK